MSRVGKKPIVLPPGVKAFKEGSRLRVQGPKGELSFDVPERVGFTVGDGRIAFELRPESGRRLTSKQKKRDQALWGMLRNVAANLAAGVEKGYQKKLEIEGLGYRAQVENGDLVVFVGFSHPLRVKKIPGIDFAVEKNVISVTGIDKNLVGQTAAKIFNLRRPDAYKGKGIRYAGQVLKKKAGKKAGTVTK